jgi:Na+/H+ antiporter NhaD/arsenite permease-like protein
LKEAAGACGGRGELCTLNGIPLASAKCLGAARFRISSKLMLLILAFSITTGSVMSPIGNPQNLLIAVYSGMAAPFIIFGLYLIIPTFTSLALVYIILRFLYPDEFTERDVIHESASMDDSELAFLVKISLAILVVLSL